MLSANLVPAELEARCARETQRYRSGQPSDTQFCLEIFRRALRFAQAPPDAPRPLWSEESWDSIVRLYTPFIDAQISRKVLRDRSREDLHQLVWLRFLRAARGELAFASLDRALAYLKLTVASALIEEQRAFFRQQREVQLAELREGADDALLRDPAADLFDQQVAKDIRARVHALLADALERRIFWLRYSMGYAPREIAQILRDDDVQLVGRAATPRAVSDILERCIRRLGNDPQIRALFGEA